MSQLPLFLFNLSATLHAVQCISPHSITYNKKQSTVYSPQFVVMHLELSVLFYDESTRKGRMWIITGLQANINVLKKYSIQ